MFIKYSAISLFLSLLVLPVKAFSQSDSLMERWAELAEDETEIIHVLQELADNPLNVNTASKAELLNLPFITQTLADTILALREQKNGFKNKRMLRPLLGKELYDLLKDFISTRSRAKSKGLFEHKSAYNLPPAKEAYVGNGWYDYNKMYYTFSPSIKAGWVSQKDAGESNYLDYSSAFLLYRRNRWSLIAGKYRLRFGRGLAFANPFAAQKSAMVSAPFRQQANGGKESLSSAENDGLFGLYAESSYFSRAKLFFFYSRSKRDVQTSAYSADITGIDYDGYHRTRAELAKKDKLSERLAGLAAQFSLLPSLRGGFLFSRFAYDPPIRFNPMVAGEGAFRRQRFKFAGKGLSQYSFFYDWQAANTLLSGEVSFSNRGAPAYAQDVFFSEEFFRLGLKYWLAGKTFQSPYGRLFADSNPFPRGKQGLYAALEFRTPGGLEVRAYKLLQKETWRSYSAPLPQTANEWLCRIELHSAARQAQFQIRQKRREDYILNDFSAYRRESSEQIISRIQGEFKASANVRLKSRFAFTAISGKKEHGRYIFQDLKYRFSGVLRLDARITFFQTDSYHSRLYEYENDLPGSFSNFALYGRGYTWYVLLKWQPVRNIALHMKFRYFLRQQKDMRSLYLFREASELKRSLRLRIKIKF